MWSFIKSFFAPKQAIILPFTMPPGMIMGSAAWYLYAWDNAKISPDWMSRAMTIAHKIIEHKDDYLKIETATLVPWQMIACLHSMECDLDFKGALHNGDEIIGTSQLTKNVPAGRGPFPTFFDGAVDALHYDGFFNKNDWNLQNILSRCERYNGLGYLKYHQTVPSPYIWSGTTFYTKGKYAGDGSFDASLVSKQVGIACILKALQALGEFKA